MLATLKDLICEYQIVTVWWCLCVNGHVEEVRIGGDESRARISFVHIIMVIYHL